MDHVGLNGNIKLFSDSSSARGACTRQGVGKIRHLAVRTLWLQQAIQEGRVAVGAIPGKENTADLGTKVLDRKTMLKYMRMLGMAAGHGSRELEEGQVQVVSKKETRTGTCSE